MGNFCNYLVLLTLITETSVGLLDFGFNIRLLTPLGVSQFELKIHYRWSRALVKNGISNGRLNVIWTIIEAWPKSYEQAIGGKSEAKMAKAVSC